MLDVSIPFCILHIGLNNPPLFVVRHQIHASRALNPNSFRRQWGYFVGFPMQGKRATIKNVNGTKIFKLSVE